MQRVTSNIFTETLINTEHHVGQGHMMDHIQTLNAASLWDKFTNGGVGPSEDAALGAVFGGGRAYADKT